MNPVAPVTKYVIAVPDLRGATSIAARVRFWLCRLTTHRRAVVSSASATRVANREPSMSNPKTRFEQAAEDVKKLSERPDNDTLLKLYALYKQGAEGDVSGPKPGFFDFVGTAKYEAWAKLKGTKSEDAMQKYIDLVKKLSS
jgi:acyl-CoA-binding protein